MKVFPLQHPLQQLHLNFHLRSYDDAPDEPRFVSDYPSQFEESDLDYYINSPSDYDWFHFVSQAEGRLKVTLVPRGNNYGLRVVLVDQDGNGTIVGEDTSSGGGTKQVTVDNAPSGNYIVRVWSLDGSFDESQPAPLLHILAMRTLTLMSLSLIRDIKTHSIQDRSSVRGNPNTLRPGAWRIFLLFCLMAMA